MQVVIPSRERIELCKKTIRLFHDPIVTVAESEMVDYSSLGCEVVSHPDDLVGCGPIRQWILDNFGDDTVFMSDDVSHVWCLLGTSRERAIRDPVSIMRILENAEMIAKAIGAHVFGFNQAWDVRKYVPQDPFRFCGWVGGAFGVICPTDLRYDTSILLRDDIDFCFQAMLKDRVVFSDRRFAFVQERFKGRGGNAAQRSAKQNQKELAHLKRKWGKWLSIREVKTTTRLVSNVTRRQKF